MFNNFDLEQIKSKGIDVDMITRQIDFFKKGFPFIQLAKPAIPGDGINVYNKEEINELANHFDQNSSISSNSFVK